MIQTLKRSIVARSAWLSPDPAFQRETAEHWNEKYRNGYCLESVFEASRYSVVATFVSRYASAGPILDLGCGDGLLAEYIRAFNSAKVTGVDCSGAAIERAKAKRIENAEFVTCDMESYCPDDAPGVLVLNESLYYLDNPGAFAARAISRMAHRGVLVVSMYDTVSTRRAWKALAGMTVMIHGVEIGDENLGARWRVRVLLPTRA